MGLSKQARKCTGQQNLDPQLSKVRHKEESEKSE